MTLSIKVRTPENWTDEVPDCEAFVEDGHLLVYKKGTSRLAAAYAPGRWTKAWVAVLSEKLKDE